MTIALGWLTLLAALTLCRLGAVVALVILELADELKAIRR